MDSSKDFLGHMLKNKFGESYFPAIIGDTFSLIGSDSFYHRHFGDVMENDGTLYIIFGTDCGLLFNWLLKKNTPKDSRYLFIEVSSSLSRLQKEGIIPIDLPDNFYVEPHENWFEKALELSMRDYFYVSRLKSIKSLAVFDGYHDLYVELGGNIEATLTTFHMQMVQETGSQIFVARSLENLAENRMAISTLDGVFAGKTAVLMAGGPSLDESFDWIRANRKNLVVLAVSRIAAQLKREKITPDFLFAIDPYGIIFHQSKEMLDFYDTSIMVNMYHLNPQLVGQWRGQSFYMGARFPWQTENNPSFMLFPGITVAHYALGVALGLGFSKIILAGIDLCFSKEGFTHAKGSAETLAGPYAKQSKLFVETNGGWQAETCADFYSSLDAMGSLAGQGVELSQRKCKVINPSKASAKIINIDHMEWDSLTTTQLSMPAIDSVNQLLAQTKTYNWPDYYKMVEGELNVVRGNLLKIKKLAEEAIACNDKLFGRKGHPPNYKYKKVMDDIELSLDNDFGDTTRLVKSWSVGELLKLSKPNRQDDWSDKEIEETGRRYYEIYRDSVRDLLKVIDESRQRVRCRMEETKPRPNIKTMINQWTKDKQPGRILLFLDRNGRTIDDFPEKQGNSLKDVAQSFADLLAETETDYQAHCKNILASPMAILGKAKKYLTDNETDKLANFLIGIKESNLDQREEFVLLMEGYLAQQAGQLDTALEYFVQIKSKLLENECLKQTLSIYLAQNDLPKAKMVAKLLSEHSAGFTPFYADLLRLTGESEKAIQKYKHYLDVVGDDFVVRQKLGKLYGDMGNITAASEVFSEILQDDPQNMAAKHFLEQYS
jgi:tetratricopeptide (TPR) repeat protein